MIAATGGPARYRTRFSNGTSEAAADTTADKGGSGDGFRPHELLEAALATCVNMTVRMYAAKHAIALAGVTTRVSLDRSDPAQAVFRYEVELEGALTPADREKLLDAARACPVRRTLSRQIRFERSAQPADGATQ
jgi:putative redox protein